MRKQILNSRLLHYTLLVLSLSGATVGGLVLLGCDFENMKDVTVVDPTQRCGYGGVVFYRSENKTQASVRLAATVEGQPVKWVPAYSSENITQIPDPSKSNEAIILCPPEVQQSGGAQFNGTYTVDGQTKHVTSYVPITIEN